MECAPHRIWKKLMALVLSLVLMAVMLPGALAVDLNVDAGFYFKQSRGGTCTLASAAMMLRRRAFLDGLTDWTDVTENSVRGSAWAGGLSHSFNYNAMQVGYSTLPSNNEEKKAVLIQLLAEHPEGIVLYDRRQPHAVLLTDYTDGVNYSAAASKTLAELTELGYGDLPVCIAKTQYSFSDNAKLTGAPTGFTMEVREVRLAAGAGFVVVICGSIMTMPGLPKKPAAVGIDVDADGKITGLF